MTLPDPVRLICPRCGRYGRYSRARYVEIAGTRNAPDALLRFARARGCKVALKQELGQIWDRCEISYDLAAPGGD